MKTRQTLLLGLAGLGFVLAAPVHADYRGANSDLSASGFVLTKRNEGETKPEFRRESREEPRARGKNNQMRETERPTHQDYGYGYERRQQPNPTRDDERGRR